MYYISTRHPDLRATLSEAICQGMAEDGGLFVPERMPNVQLNDFVDGLDYPVFAEKVLHEFFLGDRLQQHLSSICHNAFSFPVPLQPLNPTTYLLELFHGPTLSFKDVGARFLAECLDVIASSQKITILVATSGDTGSAVASAFFGKKNVNVIILFPKGQITKRQEQQITCWGQNILSCAVQGTFDDCQRLVKEAFQDVELKKQVVLSSANSINIGRLLPQITYYAHSSLAFYRQHHTVPGYIVPTGNLGNATAAYFAKLMGFPIREIVLATNANRVIPDFLQTGDYQPRPSIATLANAMDVGHPSNFERINYLFKPFLTLKHNVIAFSVSDEEIRHTIQATYQDQHIIICPHTATGVFVRQKLSNEPWIVAATADPSKFDSVIEPLIQMTIPTPRQLEALLAKPTSVCEIENNIAALRDVIANTSL